MGLLDTVRGVLGDADTSATRTFTCTDCGHSFETAKNHEHRISCPECVSGDVELESG